MGKSLGNYIGVSESAYDQFAKTMSIADALMGEWFTLLTDRGEEEIVRLVNPATTHPMQAKKTLGRDIVAFYHGPAAAEAATAEWERRFSQRQDPTEIEEGPVPAAELADGKLPAFKLVALLFGESNNSARRLIQGGGVTTGPDKEKVADPNQLIAVTAGLIVRVGNRRVKRVRLT
jgi:tyrosyl-tRNA synthetase